MKIINLEKDIFIYHFEIGKFSLNIFVIQHKDTCTIIETAFEKQFSQVIEDLEKKGLKIIRVIGTHFHPDHIHGLPLVKDVEIIGSIHSEETLKYFFKNYHKYLPNKLVEDDLTFNFGRHTFNIELCQGHSISGLLITLNSKYLFVGDELVYENNGDSVIPICFERGPDVMIDSINKIMSIIDSKVIVPTHGLPIYDKEFINKDLHNRLAYLKYLSKKRTATYEDFVKDTNITFRWGDGDVSWGDSYWHLYNQIGDLKWVGEHGFKASQ